MGSTAALCNSERSGSAEPAPLISLGPSSPVFHCHGRRSFQVRPCDRNRGQNALNANQRAYNSPVSSLVGIKPPVSLPQYGSPESPVLMATGTCNCSVSHVELISPDQTNAPNRCVPGTPLRCSAKGRTFGRSINGPS